MRGQVTLGHIAGIEIRLHFSWLMIAVLLTASLAAHLYSVNPEWPGLVVWTAALVAALAFFSAILLHELSHAAVARMRGIPVPSITLFALGGLARMSRDTADARTEFWMGLAAPAASVVIGLAALGVASGLGWGFDVTPRPPGMVMLVWFGFINLTVAAFNMIPGFPLDGGRVLRAVIWWWTGNQVRATRIAAGLGQLVALAFIGFGVLSFVRGGGFGGLWLALIGMFLADAARSAAFETTVGESLRGIRVADAMSRNCTAIPPARPLSEIADDVLRTGNRCFFVAADDELIGIVTPLELRSVPRDRWRATRAEHAMRPAAQLHRISPDAPVTEALETIGREDVNQLPVIDDGRLLGIISRDQILRLVSARAELTM